MKSFLRLYENGGKTMLTFIAGVAIGSCTMLIIMSLMVVAKKADQQIEISLPKEYRIK
jgi:hypothetical protein